MLQNIVNYETIRNAKVKATSSISLFEILESYNSGIVSKLKEKGVYDKLNSFRVYVHTGTLGVTFDSSVCSESNFFGVDEGSHLIENCDLEKVRFAGIGGEVEFNIAISTIG